MIVSIKYPTTSFEIVIEVLKQKYLKKTLRDYINSRLAVGFRDLNGTKKNKNHAQD